LIRAGEKTRLLEENEGSIELLRDQFRHALLQFSSRHSDGAGPSIGTVLERFADIVAVPNRASVCPARGRLAGMRGNERLPLLIEHQSREHAENLTLAPGRLPLVFCAR
jgi:hypothetical protein